jgi:hypothetical protein
VRQDCIKSSSKLPLWPLQKVLFNQGSLERIAPTHEAQLILHIKDGRDSKTPGFAKEDIAKMRCRGSCLNQPVMFYF